MLNAINNWLVEIADLPVFIVPSIGPAQAVDILIVALILYLIVKWIKKTQAWVVLKGLALILLIAVLAQLLGLVVVQWILDTIIGTGLVIVVILFQPELRKALEQIGRGQYLFNLKGDDELEIHTSAHTVDEIIKATRIMSKAKTGALIVMEQSVNINEHETAGIRMDAQVSAQLLLNIFEKNTPLHDGAVIIRENRISSAMCILPLTTETVDPSLGTRHRAALGISEASDARVVVVSEETGTISLVIGGEVMRGVVEAKIRDMLIWGEPVKYRFSLFRSRKRG